jgi:hypothetical protein
MLHNAAKGALAGLAGTTALDAATYVDMAVRGRPASQAPAQMIEEAAGRAGAGIPGEGEARQNRLEGLGALAGIATGVAVGVAAGQCRGLVRRLGPLLGPAVLGGAAMAVSDTSMAMLGVTQPRTWDAASWLSDAVPHLLYGAVTWTALAR